MKESEAKAKCDEIIANRKEVFCPLIRSMCRTDCEAFAMPEVYNFSIPFETPEQYISNNYSTKYGYCTASCLKGREM